MIYLIAMIAALTGFLFGFDEGIMSGVLSSIQKDFGLDDKQTGFMMGLLPFGALASSLITGKLCDWCGRLSVLRLVPVIFALAIFLVIGTHSYIALCLARLLLGVSIGMSVVVSPLYIAETAPSEIRGRLIVYFQLAITIGILISYILNVLNASHEMYLPWRWMFGVGFIPAAILFLGALFLPESPRWLCMQGEMDRAEAVLRHLYTANSNKRAKEAADEIAESIRKEHLQRKNQWKALFSKKVRPCLAVGVLLFFFQQMSGINVIIYYAPIIFNKLHLGGHMASLLATVGVGTVNVLLTLVAMRWVEKMGRRPLLLLGFAGTAVSLLIIAIISFLGIESLGWLAAVCVFIYIAFFAVSLGPLPWVMMPEVFPLNARGAGSSCSAASNWLFNTLVVATFPILLQNIGIGLTFAFYAIACVVGYLFAMRYVPETKYLSLEEIEAHIHSGKPFRTLNSGNK